MKTSLVSSVYNRNSGFTNFPNHFTNQKSGKPKCGHPSLKPVQIEGFHRKLAKQMDGIIKYKKKSMNEMIRHHCLLKYG